MTAQARILDLRLLAAGEHNLKEEEVLYPAIDGMAGPEPEPDAPVRKLQLA